MTSPSSCMLPINENQLIVKDEAFDTLLSLYEDQTNHLQKICRTKQCFVELTAIQGNNSDDMSEALSETNQEDPGTVKDNVCKICLYEFTNIAHVKRHMQSKHDNVSYSCKKCEYVSSEKSNLIRHDKSQHQRIEYNCNKCEYFASDKSHLKRHHQAKH